MYGKNGSIVDKREMLRVKVKSLSEEARIIRREEQKTRGTLRAQLAEHRRGVLRREARAAHLAYGFILGRSLREMEALRHTEPDWTKIERLCRAYGPPGFEVPKAA